jgi:DNA-directed RNA polymerase subunit RPC12/RpoP
MKNGGKILATCKACARRFSIDRGRIKVACPHCGHVRAMEGVNTR